MPDPDQRPPPAYDDLFSMPLARRTDRFFAILTVLPLALLPLGGFVTLLLVVLRVTEQWTLAWGWVFSPIWIPLAVSIVSLILGLLCGTSLPPSSSRGES